MNSATRLAISLIVGACTGQSTDPDSQVQAKQELESLKQSVEQGDADAQVSLGMMYGRGEGVPQNHTEAAKWHRKAAE